MHLIYLILSIFQQYVLNKAYSSLKPRGFVRMKTTAVVAFIAGAILLLFGGIGAFYLWKVSEKEVSVSEQTVQWSKLVWLKIRSNFLHLSMKFSPQKLKLELLKGEPKQCLQ